jgi:purine-nucleoside phosphorylase
MSDFDRIEEAAASVRSHLRLDPAVGIVLGSGLAEVATAIEGATSLSCAEVLHWPATTVGGHESRIISGTLAGKPVVVLIGRLHYYEGYELAAVVFPVRVLWRLGVRTLVLTNAAGGISDRLSAGMLMVIDDHINLVGQHPLRGPAEPRFGPRFPDMTEVYSVRLGRLADEAARALALPMAHGVYAAVAGPGYETPAEIRYLRGIGVDAVGMSTVPEAIVAKQMGLEILAIACIANRAAGLQPHPLSHDEVLRTSSGAAPKLLALLQLILARL